MIATVGHDGGFICGECMVFQFYDPCFIFCVNWHEVIRCVDGVGKRCGLV